MTQRDSNESPDLESRVTRLETQMETLLAVVGGKDKDHGEDAADLSGWLRQIGKLLGSLLGSVLGAASIFYLLGFVIVNVYLLSLGIRDLTLDKPSYLAAGISFTVLHVLIAIVSALFARYVLNYALVAIERALGRFKSIGAHIFIRLLPILASIVQWAATSVVLGMALERMAGSYSSVASANRLFYAISIGLFIVLFFWILNNTFVSLSILELANKDHTKSAGELTFPSKLDTSIMGKISMVSGLVLVIIFSLFFLLYAWGKVIYPDLSPAFGGGMPTPVQLVLAEVEDASAFAQVGIDSTDLLTEPVRLVDVSEGGLIVLVDDGNAVRLDREKVASILYLAPDDAGGTPSPTPSASPTP